MIQVLASQRIGFIGAGNMATAIIGGLIEQGLAPSNIMAAEPSEDRLKCVSEQLGISTTTDNNALARDADIIVLAVKPQVLQSVAQALRADLRPDQLLVSIAAGVDMETLESWLRTDKVNSNKLDSDQNTSPAIVRVMPNTPAQVLKGASGLFANAAVTAEQRELASALFAAIGSSEWLAQEDLMHAVTALSGSGPAYGFLVIEAMEQAAIAQGIEPDMAREFAAQTLLGAAQMVLSNPDISPGQLKRNVMSPGGTTERAVSVLEGEDVPGIMKRAMDAALARSVELGELLKQS